MPDIYTLTLNPCFDITLFVDDFKNNHVSRVKNEIKQAAGKGINVGKVLEQLGIMPYYCGLIGKNNKDEYFNLLNKNQANMLFTEIEGNVRENITVRNLDETYKINRSGTGCCLDDLMKLLNRILQKAKKDDIIAISGSLPKGISNSDFIIACNQLKSHSIKIALDCDFLSYNELIQISPWLYKVNSEEFGMLCCEDFSNSKAFEKANHILFGGTEYVVITCGCDGLIGFAKDKYYKIDAPTVCAKSTVGAGDSVLAGMLFALCNGYSFEDTLILATSCGTAAVLQDASCLAEKDAIMKIFENIKSTLKITNIYGA